jgi:hypothetical protein
MSSANTSSSSSDSDSDSAFLATGLVATAALFYLD